MGLSNKNWGYYLLGQNLRERFSGGQGRGLEDRGEVEHRERALDDHFVKIHSGACGLSPGRSLARQGARGKSDNLAGD